jgi:hypothetical protein
MMTASAPGADKLYAMHRRWLSEVLGTGDRLSTGALLLVAEDLVLLPPVQNPSGRQSTVASNEAGAAQSVKGLSTWIPPAQSP